MDTVQDDARLRKDAAATLQGYADAIARVRSGYYEQHIPAPTREHPLPPAEHLAVVRALKKLEDDIAAQALRVRSIGVTLPKYRLQDCLLADYGIIDACDSVGQRYEGLSVEGCDTTTLASIARALDTVRGAVNIRARIR